MPRKYLIASANLWFWSKTCFVPSPSTSEATFTARYAIEALAAAPQHSFAHFQTMCPKLCVRYETTPSQPIANCGKSAKTRPLPRSASLAQALAGLWQDSFRATAGAVASFCCSCSCTVSARWQKGCSSPAPPKPR